MKYIVSLILSLAAITSVYASDVSLNTAECPYSETVYFVKTAGAATGYFYGQTSEGRNVESEVLTIPNEFTQNGYTLNLTKKYVGVDKTGADLVCGYKLTDKITGKQTFTIFLSSTIIH